MAWYEYVSTAGTAANGLQKDLGPGCFSLTAKVLLAVALASRTGSQLTLSSELAWEQPGSYSLPPTAAVGLGDWTSSLLSVYHLLWANNRPDPHVYYKVYSNRFKISPLRLSQVPSAVLR